MKPFPLTTLRADRAGPVLERLTRRFWIFAALSSTIVPYAIYALAGAPQSSLTFTIMAAATMMASCVVSYGRFIRLPSKGTERFAKYAQISFPSFAVLYLALYGTFTFAVPNTHNRYGVPWVLSRETAGFACKAFPDLTPKEKRECPFFGPDTLAASGYQADSLWQPYSIDTIVFGLVSLWFGFFLCFGAWIGNRASLWVKKEWYVNSKAQNLTDSRMSEAGGRCIRKSNSGTVVIFVHGILSNGEQAWLNGNGTWWPKLVADDNSIDASVYTFSYRSDLLVRTYSLADVVSSLREFFNLDELWAASRIVFVCHSMGGIVVRRFIVQNQANFIERHTELGLFLLASPSLGSRDANSLAGLIGLIGNSQAEALRFSQTNVWLNELDQDFITLKESGRFRIMGKELVEDRALRPKRFLALFRQTVEPFSAARYFGQPYKVPWSDHSSIVKPPDANAVQHRQLILFIREMCAWRPPVELKPQPINASDRDEARGALVELNDVLLKRRNIPAEVLAIFNDALMETRHYMADKNRGDRRDLAKENQISRLWIEAAEALWRYDPELAGRCMIKGNGWADETVWEDERYRDLPLKLNDMMERMLKVSAESSNVDVVEGEFEIACDTWRTQVMLPPFKAAPQITLAKIGLLPKTDPKVETVTPDQFTIRIVNSDQAGKYKWRARGTLLH